MTAMYRAQSLDRRLYGVFAGIVEDNDDPEHEGRIKVRFPWLDDATVSEWCRVMMPYAGKDFGACFVPEKRTEVLVAFTHGDMNEPVVIGGLYNGKDKPPTYHDGTTRDVKMIKTRVGHVFRMDDSDQSRAISFETEGGHSGAFDDQNKNITLSSAGGHLAVLDDQQRKLTITSISGHVLELDDNGMKVTLASAGSAGSVTIDGSGNIKVSGTKITLAAAKIEIG